MICIFPWGIKLRSTFLHTQKKISVNLLLSKCLKPKFIKRLTHLSRTQALALEKVMNESGFPLLRLPTPSSLLVPEQIQQLYV